MLRARGASAQDLAEAIGVSPAYVSQFLNHKQVNLAEHLREKVAEFLGTTIPALYQPQPDQDPLALPPLDLVFDAPSGRVRDEIVSQYLTGFDLFTPAARVAHLRAMSRLPAEQAQAVAGYLRQALRLYRIEQSDEAQRAELLRAEARLAAQARPDEVDADDASEAVPEEGAGAKQDRELALALAVLGRASEELMARILETARIHIHRRLRRARRNGLVVQVSEGVWQLADPSAGPRLLAELLPDEVQNWERRAATAIESLGEYDPLELAGHLERSGQIGRAVSAYRLAGQRQLAAGQVATAITAYQTGLELAGSADLVTQARLSRDLALALAAGKLFDEAVVFAQRSFDAFQVSGHTLEAVQTLILLARLRLSQGRAAEAKNAASEALALLETTEAPPRVAASALLLLGQAYADLRETQPARASLLRTVGLAEAAREFELVGQAAEKMAALSDAAGQPEEARRWSQRAQEAMLLAGR